MAFPVEASNLSKSGVVLSIPLTTQSCEDFCEGASFWKGDSTTLSIGMGNALIRPVDWWVAADDSARSFLCSGGALGATEVGGRKFESGMSGYLGVFVPPDAWMPLAEFENVPGDALGIASDALAKDVCENLLPTSIRHRVRGGPINTCFKLLIDAAPQRRSSVNWAVSSSLIAPVLSWETRWK